VKKVYEYGRYRREKFVIQSRAGVAVLGYLLTPARSGDEEEAIGNSGLPAGGGGVKTAAMP
jgi:hypothetical protein